MKFQVGDKIKIIGNVKDKYKGAIGEIIEIKDLDIFVNVFVIDYARSILFREENLRLMERHRKSLSNKTEDLTGGDMQEIENWDGAIHTKDAEHHIQNAQKKLKEEFDNGDWETEEQRSNRNSRIDRIFLEEFGDKFVKVEQPAPKEDGE